MTLDLDAIEQAARAAERGEWYDRYIAATNPATVLALIARLLAAEALLTEFVADWEDGADFDHRQLRGYVNAARAILPPATPTEPPSGVGTF